MISRRTGHTDEGLGATALLDDLDDTRLKLLNGRDVVGKYTHFTRLGGKVDLDDVLRLEDSLVEVISMRCCKFSHDDGAPRWPAKTVSARAIGSRKWLNRFVLCFGGDSSKANHTW